MGIVVPLRTTKRPERPHPRGRRCAVPKCDTILNAYNPGPCCHVHGSSDYLKYRDTIRLLMDGAA